MWHSRKPAAPPAAPYEQDPTIWAALGWYDRASGRPIDVITAEARAEPERFAEALSSGAVMIETLATVLGRYTRRPEHKSLGPDCQTATSTTMGLLQRRPISSTPAETLLTSKDGNKIFERLTSQVTKVGDYQNDYGTRGDSWEELILPVLKDMGAKAVVAAGIPSSSVYDVLNGARPHDRSRDAYLNAAVNHATGQLESWGVKLPDSPLALLRAYLRE